jgi:outer membrane protein assembly factor BamB
MKQTRLAKILAAGAAFAAALGIALAQETTTTTTITARVTGGSTTASTITTNAGTITAYTPDSGYIMVRSSTEAAPVRYSAQIKGSPWAPASAANALPFGGIIGMVAGPTAGQDWTNLGGNASRNGMSSVRGPMSDQLAWGKTDFSIITWHPFIMDGRVFAIRQSGFPGVTAGDELIAWDLETGAELWRTVVPYGGDPDTEWIAYIAGVHDGRVYTARGGSGRQTPIYGHDAATGKVIWQSVGYVTDAGPQDGVVFADDGDLIVGDFDQIVRLQRVSGEVVWETARSCPVSGNCGASLGNGAAYIDTQTPTGPAVTRVDLATGAIAYSSPGLSGLTSQNSPFVGPDGTVYFARSQNNNQTDFLYAFEDTGSALVERWNFPIRWTTSHEHGIGPDGSIYTFARGDEFVRLDPATGTVLDNAGVLAPIGVNLSPRTAVDANGNVYVSNGFAETPDNNGRVWAFNQDLSQKLFVLELNRNNAGGPALGGDGFLVVADRHGVYAYRTDAPTPTPTPTATATPTATPILRPTPTPRLRPTPAPRP